jgi:steroid delta-isomerase-like uncharacterized protein
MTLDSRAVLKGWLDAVNRHDVEAALSCYAPDYRDRTAGHEDGDRDSLRAAFVEMFGAFPDLRYTAEDVIVEGDKLVERFSSVGTHEGELMGMPPTGRQITITGINVYRMVDGKIAERWAQIDDAGMMQQLGLAPSELHHHSR